MDIHHAMSQKAKGVTGSAQGSPLWALFEGSFPSGEASLSARVEAKVSKEKLSALVTERRNGQSKESMEMLAEEGLTGWLRRNMFVGRAERVAITGSDAVLVVVGSTSKLKLSAVETAARDVGLAEDIAVVGCSVDSRVPPQPVGVEVRSWLLRDNGEMLLSGFFF
jgi:hypothetical protein